VEIDPSQYSVKYGDILFTTSSETPEEVGMSSVWLFDAPHIYLNSFCFGYRPTTFIEPYFWAYVLRSTFVREQITLLAQGISRYNISKIGVMNINLMYPKHKSEQAEIGEWFERLDDMIANADKEVTRLEKMKIASFQKMFPRPGQTTPEVRFGGFTEPWETAPLGSLGDTFTGLSGKTKEDFGHGDARFITYMNVFSNPIAKFDKTDKVEIDPSQYSVKYGDILFTTSSETPEEVGMSSVWLFDAPHIYLNSFCFGYRPTTFIEPYFWAYVLRSPFMREQITLLAQGISRYNISKIGVMNINLMYPKEKSEQKAIGEYFRNIDGLIEAKRNRIVKLRNIKKACLEKMFVNNTTEQ
jgi:type I restriction enzyme S subunit